MFARTTLAAVALAAVTLIAAPASADPVEAPAGGVHVSKVDPAPAGPRITVTLSNGRTDTLRPCVYEDGRRCYWLADQMGNGRGSSFIVTRGFVFRVNLQGFDPLA